jgi:biopolymer transport protein ExbB/TolQ
MLTKLFLGFSLLGAEWVMLLLIFISVYSVTLMFERSRFYGKALKDLEAFRQKIREAVLANEWDRAREIVKHRNESLRGATDLETELVQSLLSHTKTPSVEILGEIGNDAVIRKKILWDRNLATLATVGNNAPFVGLFGTVLGIIKAFHDLSQQQQAMGGATGVMSGISEALVATGVGILVAIPAVVAYNTFQKKTKVALMNAEAMKSFIVGQITSRSSNGGV